MLSEKLLTETSMGYMISCMEKYKSICFKIAFVLLFFFVQGCATSYLVKVNGYVDPSRPLSIDRGTKLNIIEDKDTKNPLLEKEVIGKLNHMLTLKGYEIADFEKARFYMLYGYGTGHERTITSTMPVYTPGQTTTITKTGPKGTSYSTVNVPGTTTYLPYTATVSDKWLSVKIIDGEDYRKEGKTTVLWIGEASITGENNDIRYLLNYLITGIYRYFAQNTGRTLSIYISEDDPIVRSIMLHR